MGTLNEPCVRQKKKHEGQVLDGGGEREVGEENLYAAAHGLSGGGGRYSVSCGSAYESHYRMTRVIIIVLLIIPKYIEQTTPIIRVPKAKVLIVDSRYLKIRIWGGDAEFSQVRSATTPTEACLPIEQNLGSYHMFGNL